MLLNGLNHLTDLCILVLLKMKMLLEYFAWIDEDIPKIQIQHLEAELGKLATTLHYYQVTFTVEIERLADLFGVDPGLSWKQYGEIDV